MNYYLENKFIKMEFDQSTGAVIGLLNKNTGWQVIRQPKLAMGIRLLVPIEGYRNNRVLSEEQQLDSFVKTGENEAVLKWKKVKGDKSGNLDIGVELKVILKYNEIYFYLVIDNKSAYIVEEAWSPCLGGLREPEGEPVLESLTIDMCGGFHMLPLGDGMPQKCGYWGTDYPTFIKTFGTAEVLAPFVMLSNGYQGVYMGLHDEEPNLVNFVHELKPGYLDSKHARVPRGDEIGGKPAGYVVSLVRLPFVQPEERMELAPAVLTLFEGTWHNGLEPYSNWRKQWFKLRPQPEWYKDVDCWITLHINSPEGCCRYKYGELPEIAREAKEKGVQALQLIGWARDGQDGAEPYQDTDPRLGTREELKAAIKEIESMGIRVLLMCKFKWTDRAIPEYETEILPHTLKDIYGNPVQFTGYAYQTVLQQLNGGSRRCGAGLCLSSEEYRKLALREFEKVVTLGSSGILYDELMDEMLICFDRSHNHRWGESNPNGAFKLAEEFYNLARKINPDFLLTGEGPYDVLTQYYPVNYVRTEDRRWNDPVHRPALKYLSSDIKQATCLTGWDDREMVNQCIAYGYIINYEPYNFKGRLTDIPDTVAYGQKAQALRRELWDYIWEGKFCDTVGAKLETGDKDREYIYSVFENRVNGKKAVVIANQGHTGDLNAKVSLDKGFGKFKVYSIDESFVGDSDGNVKVAPRSLLVLVEV